MEKAQKRCELLSLDEIEELRRNENYVDRGIYNRKDRMLEGLKCDRNAIWMRGMRMKVLQRLIRGFFDQRNDIG